MLVYIIHGVKNFVVSRENLLKAQADRVPEHPWRRGALMSQRRGKSVLRVAKILYQHYRPRLYKNVCEPLEF